MGEVIQLRDFQSKKDIARMQQELAQEAKAILAEAVPYGGDGIDGIPYWSPDDPA